MIAPLQFFLSLSIIFAVIIGIVRFRKMDPSYYPFIYNICLALLIEVTHQILMSNGYSHPLVAVLNVYGYLDFFLFTWLFHNWGLFNRKRSVFITVVSIFFVIWLFTNVFYSQFSRGLNIYFAIIYSFALIFFSVNTFNKVIVHERSSMSRNAQFWICLGVIIFYSFFTVLNATRFIILFKHNMSMDFWHKLHEITLFSNILVNLLYAVAVLWIPRKKKYTTLF